MPSLGDLMLGSGHKRTYMPQEQAAYSAKFPGLVWRDGVPYTQAPEPTFDPNDYGKAPLEAAAMDAAYDRARDEEKRLQAFRVGIGRVD